MRKQLLYLIILCVAPIAANAQLYIDYDGHTAIGDLLNTDALFNVTSNASESYLYKLVNIESTNSNSAIEIWNRSTAEVLGYHNDVVGASVYYNVQPYRNNYGIRSYPLADNTIESSHSYGLLSFAGYANNGWNYGVCASLIGPRNGAGIYASSGSYVDGIDVQGRWAGYFNGNVNVLGTLTATTLTQTSDYRLKENIRQIDNGSLDKVMGMNVVKYRLKNPEVDLGDTAKTIHYAYPEDSPFLKTDHFGLIAQELKEIYPELVNEGEDGYLSVNYIELIPILIKSIQELTSKVDAFEKENGAAKTIQKGNEKTNLGGLSLQAILYQNDPNPFTENTTIDCVIPSSVQNAVLYIYDMNGHQIDSRTIAERRNASLTIQGSSLDAGMYLYSLITDGTVVDTKRMILTK